MYYIVYETTNMVNGKFYIGVHRVNNSKYLGSGKALKCAINKYGRDKFMREVLHEFSNKRDAYKYESLVVNESMVNNKNCYNMTIGGISPPGISLHSEETKRKIRETRIAKGYKGSNHSWWGKKHSEETKNKIRVSATGRKMSDSTKAKMSKSHQTKIYIIDGNSYISSRVASNTLNIPHSTISYRCKSDKFLNYTINTYNPKHKEKI